LETTYLLWGLVVLMIVVGLAGTILPAIPGVGLVFAGLFLGAYIDDFQRVGWVTLVALGLMTALAMAIDFIATLFGAKRMGASRLAMVGAAIGAIAGLFFGLVGVFVGPFVGAVVGELIHRGKLDEAAGAAKVGLGTWLGLLLGTLAKLALALTMIGVFVVSYLWK
jgi:uncharacterized protein